MRPWKAMFLVVAVAAIVYAIMFAVDGLPLTQLIAQDALWAAAIALVVGTVTYGIAIETAGLPMMQEPKWLEIWAHDYAEFQRMCGDVRHRVETALAGSYVWGAIVYAAAAFLLTDNDVSDVWPWVGIGWFAALMLHGAHKASWDRRLDEDNFDWRIAEPGKDSAV